MLHCYVSKKFAPKTQATIAQANDIIDEYDDKGFSLTLRQLYYQFVARDLIPNAQNEYKKLGSIINDARLAGLVSWYSIEDRTRNLRARQHWDTPKQILEAAASGFFMDRWEGQPFRPEVWIEKDALVGVIQGVCRELDVPYFACRGYTSQSEQWRAARRFKRYRDAGQKPVVIHLGDHDPSGIDMTRDIHDRLQLLSEGAVEVRRIALNMAQVKEKNPPPNPAKLTDTRAGQYLIDYGPNSWELDALDPEYIEDIIRNEVIFLRDEPPLDAVKAKEKEGLDQLRGFIDQLD